MMADLQLPTYQEYKPDERARRQISAVVFHDRHGDEELLVPTRVNPEVVTEFLDQQVSAELDWEPLLRCADLARFYVQTEAVASFEKLLNKSVKLLARLNRPDRAQYRPNPVPLWPSRDLTATLIRRKTLASTLMKLMKMCRKMTRQLPRPPQLSKSRQRPRRLQASRLKPIHRIHAQRNRMSRLKWLPLKKSIRLWPEMSMHSWKVDSTQWMRCWTMRTMTAIRAVRAMKRHRT